MTKIDAVLFDVGNVLVEWDPRHLYRRIFVLEDSSPDEARIEWFLSTICTTSWHVQHDLGRGIEEQLAELIPEHPDYRGEIEAFYGRFQEMIPSEIGPMVAAKRQMRSAGVRTFGLTNFGAETFRQSQQRFDFLREFDDVVVSGEEGMIKPDPAIFELCIARFGLTPERTLFIDDSERNVASARVLGFETHLFNGPEACLERLRAHALI